MRGASLGWVLLLVGCGAAAPPRPAPPSAPAAAALATTPDDMRTRFAAAHKAVAGERYNEAIPLLEPLCPVYAQLGDYCLRDLAVCRSRSGDSVAAEALWARLSTEYPQSIYAARAQLERGRLREQAGDAAGARALYDAARLSEDDDVALRALIELADLEASTGSVVAADTDLMLARNRGVGTALGAEAKRRQEALRIAHPELAPRGAARLSELRLLVKERDFGAARALADQLVDSGPASDRVDALRLRADAELGSGDVEAGLRTLDEIVRLYPDSAAAAEAQYRSATLLWNRDRNAEARAAFLEFRRRFPDDSHAPDALYALARIAQSDSRDEDAIALYTELADRYPASSVARDARWRIGWIRYVAGRYRDAAAAFARAANSGTAADVPEAYYWQGRALERTGDRDAAARLYTAITATAPASYYAGCAEQRLGHATAVGVRVTDPPPPRAIGPAPAGTDPYHWTRAAELQAIGFPTLARTELRAFERGQGDGTDSRPLIEAYQATGGYREAIRLGSARGLTDPDIFFPLAFWPQVSRSTRQADVDPLFVLALMRQESMFDPSARSSADARGLMQLLPSTAERTARTLPQPVATDNLYDPDTNITVGVAHVRELLTRYGGDRIKVLAAYNGGEGAVARWEARFGGLEPDEFVESITYRETRDYVKRVLGNYRRYQQTYAAR